MTKQGCHPIIVTACIVLYRYLINKKYMQAGAL